MLKASGVSLLIDGKRILSDIDITLNMGESIALIGPNGSGKTTLMNILSGLLKPTEGSVELDGKDVYLKKNESFVRGSISYVFQDPERLLFSSSVRKEAEFSIKDIKKFEREKRIDKWMERLSLDRSILSEHPLSLSGGEKRKVALLSILVRESPYIFFDEPIASLDPISRESFISLISALSSDGKCVLIITHSSESASFMDRVFALQGGECVFDGKTRDAFSSNSPLDALTFLMPPICRISKSLGLGDCFDKRELVDSLKRRKDGKR